MIFRRNILSLQTDKNNMQVAHRLLRHIAVILAAASLMLTGCSKYKEIRPTSFKLESVSVQGLRSIVLEVSVGVHNPAGQLSFSNVSAELEHSGKVLGKMTLAPFTLMPKSDTVYRLKGGVVLSDELSVVQALSYARHPERLNDAKLDVTAKAQLKSGLHKTMTFNDIPVEKLLKLSKQ